MKSGIIVSGFMLLASLWLAGPAWAEGQCLDMEQEMTKFFNSLTIKVDPGNCRWVSTDQARSDHGDWIDAHGKATAICGQVNDVPGVVGRYVAMGYVDNGDDEIRCCRVQLCRDLDCH